MKLPNFIMKNRLLFENSMALINVVSNARLFIKKRKDESFNHLPIKQYAELMFWKDVIRRRVLWYRGLLPEFAGVPVPSENIKVKDFTLNMNALLTWHRVMGKKYLGALKVDDNYFKDMTVLDIGCGPDPHMLAFKNCSRYGLDELVDEYRALGFPLDYYKKEITYLKGGAESIPAEDNSFDAVVSVNALDHVDDFPKAAKEIRRVLKPGGLLRLQVHYHSPTLYEPWQLNDKTILDNFGMLGIKKINEKSDQLRTWERYVIWSTHL